VSIVRACGLLNLSRSVFHYASARDDRELEEALLRITGEHPGEGLRKVVRRLQGEGNASNHKRIHRMYRKMGLTIRKRWEGWHPLRNRDLWALPPEPDHTWALDFAAGTLWEWKDYRTFHLMDECTREALYVEPGFELGADRIVRALGGLAERGRKPGRLRVDSDHGLDVTALEEWGRVNGVEISYAHPDEHPRDTFLERLGTVFQWELGYYILSTLRHVREAAAEWTEYYNLMKVGHAGIAGTLILESSIREPRRQPGPYLVPARSRIWPRQLDLDRHLHCPLPVPTRVPAKR